MRKATNITDSALGINQKQFPDEVNILNETAGTETETETEHPTSNVVPIRSYHDPNKQSNTSGGLKVMMFVTTHISSEHIWHLKSCWPPALQNSVLLNTADAVVYLNPKEEERKEAMDILHHTFRDQNLTIHVRDNPGYQEGAMAALSDATREGWFSGYDWVIQHPDVIIRDDTFMLDAKRKSRQARDRTSKWNKQPSMHDYITIILCYHGSWCMRNVSPCYHIIIDSFLLQLLTIRTNGMNSTYHGCSAVQNIIVSTEAASTIF